MPHIIVGEPCYLKYSAELSSFGLTPISLKADPRLDGCVSTHPDTLIFSDGFAYIINEENLQVLPEEIRSRMMPVSDTPYGGYPTDTALNAVRVGRYLFARLSSLAPSVRGYAEENGIELVNVNQGYARCSALPLPAVRAAITADPSLAAAMEGKGIEVLRIRPGHIALEGHDYGFIGGASFVYEPRGCCSISDHSRYVYFFGQLRRHPDGEAVREFLSRHGYAAVCLGGELTDYGGAVII